MSSQMEVPINAKSGSIEAVVIRCGCGNPAAHLGAVCPKGRSVNLGTVAYFNRNPLRQAAWDVFNTIRTFIRSKTKWHQF